jgi:hypothetical protein
MNVDELLTSLRSLPQPRLSPFFAARVTQQTSTAPRVATRIPLLLRAYWLLLAFFAGVVLLQSWIGVVLIIVAAGAAALIPAGALPPPASRRELRR